MTLHELPSRLVAVAAACLLLAARTPAQQREPYVEYPDKPTQEDPPKVVDPSNAFEFTLGDDGLWFGYRNGLHRGKGYFGTEFFSSKEDDFALQARLMRFGEPSQETPLGLGIGLGLFGAAVDETDDEVLAITLTAAADYALDKTFLLAYPLRVGVEFSYAPDVATFADGERVIDILGRLELDLSTWATAFAGYRHLEVDLHDEDDAELDSALQVGIRLGL